MKNIVSLVTVVEFQIEKWVSQLLLCYCYCKKPEYDFVNLSFLITTHLTL